MFNKLKESLHNRPLILILFLAFVLRLWGIAHGFPYIFHPDEPAIIRGGLGIRFSINPGHFDWPHLYFYLNYLVFYGFSFIRDVFETPEIRTVFPLVWNDKLIFYLLSRILTAIIGTLTVLPMYLAAKNLFGIKAGLIAGLALACIPLHVKYSHLALPDIPMILFLCWYIYFVTSLYSKPTFKNYALAGLFLGLSATTKYNGGIVVIYLLLVHLVTQGINVQGFKKLVVAGFTSLIGFLLGTPFVLSDFSTFIISDGPKGALWQFANTGSVPQFTRITAFLNYFTPNSTADYGYSIFYIFLGGLAYLLILKLFSYLRLQGKNIPQLPESDIIKKLLPLYIPVAIFIYIISGFVKNMPHYYLIAYPLVILGFSYYLSAFTGYIRRSSSYSKKTATIFVTAIYLIVFGIVFYASSLSVQKLIAKKSGPAVAGMIEGYSQDIP